MCPWRPWTLFQCMVDEGTHPHSWFTPPFLSPSLLLRLTSSDHIIIINVPGRRLHRQQALMPPAFTHQDLPLSTRRDALLLLHSGLADDNAAVLLNEGPQAGHSGGLHVNLLSLHLLLPPTLEHGGWQHCPAQGRQGEQPGSQEWQRLVAPDAQRQHDRRLCPDSVKTIRILQVGRAGRLSGRAVKGGVHVWGRTGHSGSGNAPRCSMPIT